MERLLYSQGEGRFSLEPLCLLAFSQLKKSPSEITKLDQATPLAHCCCTVKCIMNKFWALWVWEDTTDHLLESKLHMNFLPKKSLPQHMMFCAIRKNIALEGRGEYPSGLHKGGSL